MQRRHEAEEDGWRELEELLKRIASDGERSLSFEDVDRLGVLYRHAAAQLAESRQSGDQRRRSYLEALVHRAHYVVYPAPRGGWRSIGALFLGGFARAFRQTGVLGWIAVVLFVVGAAAGFLATLEHIELAYPLVGVMYPPEILQALIESSGERAAFLSVGQDTSATFQTAFASGLVANNTRVAFAAFALGIAAGLPTIVLHVFNGALLGSFAAIFVRGGHGAEFFAWVLPHGIPEVLALCIACAAGLRLGLALVAPGPRSRGQALSAAGRGSAVLLGLAVILLLYAALIEGYFRQSHASMALRYGLAAFNALAIAAYLGLAGREGPAHENDKAPPRAQT